ncbi:MAG TPA: hypothetical protein VE983_07065, partial [Solirubrobacteraceae bacterium]|nr:hypothetical protein [Solirubrobacteraceae bacterium]
MRSFRPMCGDGSQLILVSGETQQSQEDDMHPNLIAALAAQRSDDIARRASSVHPLDGFSPASNRRRSRTPHRAI